MSLLATAEIYPTVNYDCTVGSRDFYFLEFPLPNFTLDSGDMYFDAGVMESFPERNAVIENVNGFTVYVSVEVDDESR